MSPSRMGMGLIVALGVLIAPTASAEIYKCVGRDGKTVFTSGPSTCPGRKPHEIRGTLQTVPMAERSVPARRTRSSAGPAAPAVEDGQAAMWRRKRAETERELVQLREQVPDYYKYVGWCNRGSDLYIRDEAGMKRGFSCKRVRSEHERLVKRQTELEAYLEDGLAEECRKAGCLPGWIR